MDELIQLHRRRQNIYIDLEMCERPAQERRLLDELAKIDARIRELTADPRTPQERELDRLAAEERETRAGTLADTIGDAKLCRKHGTSL